MAKLKTQNGTDDRGQPDEEPQTVEATGPTPGRLGDPWERWSQAEPAWWPSWVGRRLPDRFFGDFGTLFEHIKIEEYVEDDRLVVRAEIPGVDPDEDIDISVDRDRLTIRAERSSKVEDTTDGYHSEFRYGSFSRVVGLPDGVDVDRIEANYADGILRVSIPLAADEQRPTTKVPVSRG